MSAGIWVLAVLVVAGALWMLLQAARRVWGQTKDLGRAVGDAADRVAQVTAALSTAHEQMAARTEPDR